MNDERDNHSIHAKVTDYPSLYDSPLPALGVIAELERARLAKRLTDFEKYVGRPAQAPTTLPTDAKERKATPIVAGVLDYFPAAIAEVARVSKAGNDQHNPGQPMHWARGKSMDHADCIVRHLMERGTIDTDGIRHAAKVAWRALALLQIELEEAGAPMSRGSKLVDPFPGPKPGDSR